MADEEVKPIEEVAQVPTETVEEVPAEAKQEELPLVAESAEPEAKSEESPKVEEPKPDWRERELKAKHRQLKELQRKLEETEREKQVAQALAAKFNQKTETAEFPAVVPADEVDKRAQQIVANQRYVEDCNKTAQKGEQVYGESWKEAVSNLEMLGGFDQDTMNGVLATDDPAKVLFELGKNPDQYRRIMELQPAKRIIEMGKIAMQPTQVKKVSEAPAPVNPLGGRAAPAKATLTDELDDDKWFKIRREQRRAKWEQANGIRR